MKKNLIAAIAGVFCMSLPGLQYANAGDVYTVYTYGTFNDGGTISGEFTVNLLYGLQSADVVTTAGSVLSGANYFYNISGQANTFNVNVNTWDAMSSSVDQMHFILSTTPADNLYLCWNPNSHFIEPTGGIYVTDEGISTSYRLLTSVNVPEPEPFIMCGFAITAILTRRRIGGHI